MPSENRKTCPRCGYCDCWVKAPKCEKCGYGFGEEKSTESEKRVLTCYELHSIASAMERVCTFITVIRKESMAAQAIQFPKIPSLFSESLVVHLINQGMIDGLPKGRASFGRNFQVKSDVAIEGEDLHIYTVQVKATQDKGIALLGNHTDCAADYLIWMDFGLFFHGDGDQLLEIHTLPRPSSVLQNMKMYNTFRLSKLRRLAGPRIKTSLLTQDFIRAMLQC